MANTLKLRGGTTAEVAAAKLAEREIMVDTTKDIIVVGPTKKEMAVGNGGTYTGNYTFSGDVTISGAATFGSSFNANSLRIQNVATPTGNSDACNKSYVDGLISNLKNTVLPGNVFSADKTIAITDNNPGVGDIDLSISNNSVSTAKIQDNAVTADKFADGSVTSLKLGTASVTTAKIADQAVTTAKLEVSAVTSNRIAAGAVGSTKIADNGISAIKLQSGSVTTDKLQDDAVTAAKIDDSVLATHAAQVTACANSATAAASSAASALAAFDNFDDSYLGAKASDPSKDNDGDALTAGDLYFNTKTDVMKLYTGSGWVIAYVPGEAANITNAASGNLTSTNVQSSLQELQTDIDSTVSATTTNASSITTNASNIATNVTNIATNASSIKTNATNIATNATNIATNVTNIATNATNIASNVTALGTKVPRTSATGSAQLPAGTESQRDTSPSAGFIRFNTTAAKFEGYDGTTWASVGGGLPAGDVVVKDSQGSITIAGTINGINVGRGAKSLASNTAVGLESLSSNTTGTWNTSLGQGSLRYNTTGKSNTCLGAGSLVKNTTGSNNIGIGVSSLLSNTTGSGNFGVAFLNSSGSYRPVFNPTTHSNRVVMGHTNVTNAYVKVSWTVTSDERDKMNFEAVPHGLAFVNQLKPVAYQFKANRDTKVPSGDVRYGFKAQDILALEGKNPVIIDNEDPDHLKYKGEHIVPVLVNAVQELTKMVEDLKVEVANLKKG